LAVVGRTSKAFCGKYIGWPRLFVNTTAATDFAPLLPTANWKQFSCVESMHDEGRSVLCFGERRAYHTTPTIAITTVTTISAIEKVERYSRDDWSFMPCRFLFPLTLRERRFAIPVSFAVNYVKRIIFMSYVISKPSKRSSEAQASFPVRHPSSIAWGRRSPVLTVL
jgi:hypothetical protein